MRQDEGFYIEYDDILCHNRIEFYGTYVGKSATQEDVADYLRYVFEEMLGWTPEDLRDKYTHELAEKLHISRLVGKVRWPVELDREKDLFYMAVFLYPDRITYPRKERILDYYKNVYIKKEKISQKTFYDADLPDLYLLNCARYMVDKEFGSWPVKKIYEFFTGKKKVYTEFLRKYKMTVVCQLNYEFAIDMIHEVLPEEKKDEDLYAFYRLLLFCRENKIDTAQRDDEEG